MPDGVIYARLSDVRRGDTDGIERQIREGRAHAERLGIEVVEVLVDNDLSAAKKKTRPDFVKLMEGIAENRWEVVVLRSLDRWVRRPMELEQIIDVVEKSKVRIEAIHGRIDLRTRDGRRDARVRTAFAIDEVEATSERVTDWHADRVAQGLPYAGNVAYGHNPDKLSLNEEQAERIREAARRVLDGEALAAIAADWNRRGVPAPRERWRPQTIRRLLVAPRTAGLREHRGVIVGEAQWPAILDRVTWERLVRLFNSPERLAMAPSDRRAHLLTGIAWCPSCEKGMNSVVAHGRRKYRCMGCYGVSITAEPLEDHVAERLVVALDLPSYQQAWLGVDEVDEASVVEQMAALDAERAELVQEVAEGRMLASEWRTVSAGLSARREALQRLLDRSQAPEWIGRGAELEAAWRGMDTASKRRVLTKAVDRVQVGPARVGINRFDESRVTILWRQ